MTEPPAPQVEIIVVNGSADEVVWIVERPNGRFDRLPPSTQAEAGGWR